MESADDGDRDNFWNVNFIQYGHGWFPIKILLSSICYSVSNKVSKWTTICLSVRQYILSLHRVLNWDNYITIIHNK